VPSLRLFSIRGVPVSVNASLVLGMLLVVPVLSAGAERFGVVANGNRLAAVVFLLVFTSVLLHELGHAFAARSVGARDIRIELSIFGGQAMSRHRERDPASMFRHVIAGPAMTAVAIALCEIAGRVLVTGWHDGTSTLLTNTPTEPAHYVLALVLVINLLLLVSNLMPGLPLDGGHLLSAVIWRCTGRPELGTRVAGVMGVVLGAASVVAGIVLVAKLPDLELLGVILAGTGLGEMNDARRELRRGRLVERLDTLKAVDGLVPDPATAPAAAPAASAWREHFEPSGSLSFVAVIAEDRRYLGMAHRAAVEAAARSGREMELRKLVKPPDRDALVPVAPADVTVDAVMKRDELTREGALVLTDPHGRFVGVATTETLGGLLVNARRSPR
jgi:Zn-dependent protease